MLSPEDAIVPKSRKKNSSAQKVSKLTLQGGNVKKIQELQALPIQMPQKPSRKSLVNEVSGVLQQPDKSISDSLPDSSPSSGNDYRALRHKYLLVEEESFRMGRDLKAMDDDINSLEEEKLSLLDELVVLEGLIDPSEVPKASE